MNESIMYEEVYEVLQFLGNDFIKRIPEELYKYIKDNRRIEKTNVLDFSRPNIEQELSKEAIEFISFINLEYWADDEERKELMQIYDENEIKYQKECREKYSQENIFKRRIENKETTKLVEIKEKKWYEKIFNLIKTFLKTKE